MGGKSSAPPAPDYVGAATAQAAASEKATTQQNYANRPTVNTPFGSQSWTTGSVTDPSSGQQVTTWQQNVNLDPGLQNALQSQINTQQGRSNLAAGFMDRVRGEYSQPFDYNNLPSMAGTPQQQYLQQGTANYSPAMSFGVNDRTGLLRSGFAFGGPQSSVDANPTPLALNTGNTAVQGGVDSMAGDVNRNVSTMPLINQFESKNNALARNVGPESLQRNLNTADNPALPQFDSNYRNQVADTLMQRMVPVQERQQRQLETKLSNQGFQQGSEAYKRALDELNMRQSAERYDALNTAGNEAQRLFNMGMGARQQAFNEDVTGGQFANQAAGQAFNQGLNAAQFQNQATGQAYNQSMGARQAYNQAQQQAFNQALAAGQFGNQAVQQAYAQNLGAAQFGNQAAGQAFNQGLQANQFQNQAANQLFNQNLAAGNFGNQAQQQAYNQNMGQAQLNNATQQQAFNQNLSANQFQNQALGQASALDIARMQAGNQAAQQQFGMGLQAANFQNQLRQQAIAEQAQRRGMSLNEMNALLSGQQVSMPTFPGFNTAGRAETPNILGATQMGYDAALGAVNAQNANSANMMGGLFGLGSSALMSPTASAFLFSDRRLKSNIKRVGDHPMGVGIYEYTMMGMPQRGVIAQEVQAVRPDLVKRHASGYLMVNYKEVGGV
jgi:hypothetical protein